MTTSPRPMFLRPRELVPNSSGRFFDVNCGTPVTDFEEGTFANSYALAYSFVAYLKTNDDASWEIRVNETTLRVEIYQNSGGDKLVGWSGYSSIGAWMGYTGANTTFTNGAWTAADQPPWGVWYPRLQVADQDWFKTIASERATGAMSQNGIWAGTTKGTAFYRRRMNFLCELATNVLISKQTATSYMTAEEFFTDSLTAQVSDSTYASNQGFWCYLDINDLISDCTTISDTNPWSEATDIGIDFNRDSNPDTKVFCNSAPELLPDWASMPHLPRSTLYYSFDVGFNTRPAETWVYYDYTAP